MIEIPYSILVFTKEPYPLRPQPMRPDPTTRPLSFATGDHLPTRCLSSIVTREQAKDLQKVHRAHRSRQKATERHSQHLHLKLADSETLQSQILLKRRVGGFEAWTSDSLMQRSKVARPLFF